MKLEQWLKKYIGPCGPSILQGEGYRRWIKDGCPEPDKEEEQ
jgi:hypothetical protein